MTTIVAVREGNKVFLGADKKQVDENIINTNRVFKIISVKNIVFAVSGSPHIQSLVRFLIEKLSTQDSLPANEFMHLLVSELDARLTDPLGSSGVKDNKEESFSGEAVLIVKDRIYEIDIRKGKFNSLLEINSSFFSCGSGFSFAIGMNLYLEMIGMPPIDRMKKILNKISSVDPFSGCGGLIYEVDLDKNEFKIIEDWIV